MAGAQQTEDLRFEPLGPKHDRAAFTCGIEALDRYLHQQAAQDVKRRVAAVFVLTSDGKTIGAYYALSQYSVELDLIPANPAKKLRKYPVVPATLIGRLAVSKASQGKGLGELVLMDALDRYLEGSRQAASAAVIVDARMRRPPLFTESTAF